MLYANANTDGRASEVCLFAQTTCATLIGYLEINPYRHLSVRQQQKPIREAVKHARSHAEPTTLPPARGLVLNSKSQPNLKKIWAGVRGQGQVLKVPQVPKCRCRLPLRLTSSTDVEIS